MGKYEIAQEVNKCIYSLVNFVFDLMTTYFASEDGWWSKREGTRRTREMLRMSSFRNVVCILHENSFVKRRQYGRVRNLYFIAEVWQRHWESMAKLNFCNELRTYSENYWSAAICWTFVLPFMWNVRQSQLVSSRWTLLQRKFQMPKSLP